MHGDIWVTCEVDEKPVGFCYTVTEEFADSIWNMLVIGVLLSGQRQGYGGAILSFLEATLKNQSRRILIVDTSGTEPFARKARIILQEPLCKRDPQQGFLGSRRRQSRFLELHRFRR